MTNGKPAGAAALEELAVDAAFEIDRHPIVLTGFALDRHEIWPLLAHGLEHRGDIGVCDFGARALDGDVAHGVECDLRHHLDERHIAQLGAGLCRELLDARVGGRLEVLAGDGLGVGVAKQIADDFRLHLRGVLLTHHGERRFAGAKALEARGAGDFLVAVFDFGGDALGGNGHLKTTLETRDSA